MRLYRVGFYSENWIFHDFLGIFYYFLSCWPSFFLPISMFPGSFFVSISMSSDFISINFHFSHFIPTFHDFEPNHSEQFSVLHSISIHLFSRFPRKIQLSLYGSTGSSNIFHFISLEKRALFGFLPLQQMVKINEFLFCLRTNMRCVTISYAHYT